MGMGKLVVKRWRLVGGMRLIRRLAGNMAGNQVLFYFRETGMLESGTESQRPGGSCSYNLSAHNSASTALS
jgi:hypothetical protein